MGVVTATISNKDKGEMDKSYQLLSVDIIREANRIPSAEMILLDGDASESTKKFEISDSGFFALGATITIKLRFENEKPPRGTDVSVFIGVVMKHNLRADRNGSFLTVELKDPVMKLATVKKSLVHTGKDSDIIGTLLSSLKGKVTATTCEHTELVQYNSTDWDFLVSRAEANGLLVMVDVKGKVNVVAEKDLPLSGGTNSITYGIDTVYDFEMEADATYQYKSVTGSSWDPATQKLTTAEAGTAAKLSPGTLTSDLSKAATALGTDEYALLSPTYTPQKEMASWATGQMLKSNLSLVRGRVKADGDGAVDLGQSLELIQVAERFNGKTIVTGVRHQVSHQGWQTELQFGLNAEWFTAKEEVTPLPASGLLPAIHGLHIGIVQAFKKDDEGQHRIQVLIPAIDGAKGIVWARLANIDAGSTHGVLFIPEKDDEVVVGFLNDDPRQPVILGSLFSKKNAPIFDLDANNYYKGLFTKGGSQFVFDDERKGFALASEKNGIVSDEKEGIIQITDGVNKNTITLNADGIKISSKKKLVIQAAGVEIDSGSEALTIKSGGNVTIQGSAVEVK